eukprot:1155521-Pelagomonas_calceolata.AAC.2
MLRLPHALGSRVRQALRCCTSKRLSLSFSMKDSLLRRHSFSTKPGTCTVAMPDRSTHGLSLMRRCTLLAMLVQSSDMDLPVFAAAVVKIRQASSSSSRNLVP